MAAESKAVGMLQLVRRAFVEFTPTTFATIYASLVRPYLEYAVQAWNPYLVQNMECLERIQRTATRMVKGMQRLPY